MAKTIKFNLICDNNPIRTIEDLQNNFSIEDILEYYNNRLLHRWLDVRGYYDELKSVCSISSYEPLEIVNELIKIFEVVTDEKKVEESVYIFEYLNERKKLCSMYEKENYKVEKIINNYHARYAEIVNEILENPDNIAKIKSNIEEIIKNYKLIFNLNYRNLFYILESQDYYLVVMCLLMNEHARKYYLPVGTRNEDGIITYDIDEYLSDDKSTMFKLICDMIGRWDFEEKLGENLISFSGMTDGYWKDLEPKGKKYMIISMGIGDYVRSSGVSGGDLSYEDIKNKFVILDGIDYKSNSSSRQLLYMEV